MAKVDGPKLEVANVGVASVVGEIIVGPRALLYGSTGGVVRAPDCLKVVGLAELDAAVVGLAPLIPDPSVFVEDVENSRGKDINVEASSVVGTGFAIVGAAVLVG